MTPHQTVRTTGRPRAWPAVLKQNGPTYKRSGGIKVSDNGVMTDVVDALHQDRRCPYCREPQFWSDTANDYCHTHNLNLHCDEERLALWDMSESWKRS